MKPVFQELLDMNSGDCFSACLASLLEIPCAEVPRFAAMEETGQGDMDRLACQWLKEKFNLAMIRIYNGKELVETEDYRMVAGTPGTLVIADYPSGVPDRVHSVLAEIQEDGLNVRVIHDPNPYAKPIEGRPWYLHFLVPMSFTTFRN